MQYYLGTYLCVHARGGQSTASSVSLVPQEPSTYLFVVVCLLRQGLRLVD